MVCEYRLDWAYRAIFSADHSVNPRFVALVCCVFFGCSDLWSFLSYLGLGYTLSGYFLFCLGVFVGLFLFCSLFDHSIMNDVFLFVFLAVLTRDYSEAFRLLVSTCTLGSSSWI